MSGETKPRVLIVYFTLTKQSGRVADAMAKEFEARGCEVTKAMIEFTDERWVPKLSPVPDEAPDLPGRDAPPCTVASQDRGDPHSLGSAGGRLRSRADRVSHLVVPDEHSDPLVPRVAGREGDPRRQAVRNGVDLPPLLQHQPREQRKLAEKNGGRFTDKTHFVAAGGQVKSMLSWLGYMKHGEPQERAMGLRCRRRICSPTSRNRRKRSPTASWTSVLQPVAAGSGA